MKAKKLFFRVDPAIFAVILVGLSAIGLLFYINNVSFHIIKEQQTLLNKIRIANVNTATGHIWLEEYLSGDKSIRVETVLFLFKNRCHAVCITSNEWIHFSDMIHQKRHRYNCLPF